MTGLSTSIQDFGRRHGTLVSVSLILVVIGLTTVGLHRVFTSAGDFIIWDFHSPLMAARAVLSGTDPYSEQVTKATQALVYGRPVLPTEDAQAFVYPAAVAYLLTPLTFFTVQWAQSIWLSILLAAALAGVLLCMRIWGWPDKRWKMVIVLLWSFAFYPLVWALILGQIAVLVFASLALGLWAALTRREILAGFALSLSLLKPNLSLALVVGMLIFAALTNRFRLLGAGLLGILVLVLAPMVLIPTWPISFVLRLREYLEYTPHIPPVRIIGDLCCGASASMVAVILSLLLVGATVYGWVIAVRSKSDRDLLWASGMTLIVTAAIAPRLATLNQIILLIPAIGLFGALAKKGAYALLGLALLMALWGFGLWMLTLIPPVSLAYPRYPVEHLVLSPILPASMALLWMTVMRRQVQRGEISLTAEIAKKPSDA